MSDRRRPEPTPEEKELARQRFLERLSDWSDPGAITVIRAGIPLDPEAGQVLPKGEWPTVDDVDEDGNLLMSDGTILP
jgi:hypothetical protein